MERERIKSKSMSATALLALAVLARGSPGIAQPHTDVTRLIEIVQSNERLYENIDVTLIENSRSLKEVRFKDQAVSGWRTNDKQIHYVSQEGMFHAEIADKYAGWDDARAGRSIARVFDTVTTKLLELGEQGVPGIANIITGQAEDENLVRPHMLLLRQQHWVTPLSVRLRGADAIRAYPYGKFGEDLDLTVECHGEAIVKGLRCDVVWLTHKLKSTGELNARYVLWLAKERNYIPARMEAIVFMFADDVPVTEADVTDWSELKPGIWFPTRAEVLPYDGLDIRKSKAKKLVGSWTYAIEKVSLDPHYDLAYFQKLEIPEGSAIYEIDTNKNITKSYRQGQPGVEPEKSSWWPGRWLLLWGNVAVVAITGALVLRKRLAK